MKLLTAWLRCRTTFPSTLCFSTFRRRTIPSASPRRRFTEKLSAPLRRAVTSMSRCSKRTPWRVRWTASVDGPRVLRTRALHAHAPTDGYKPFQKTCAVGAGTNKVNKLRAWVRSARRVWRSGDEVLPIYTYMPRHCPCVLAAFSSLGCVAAASCV
ncbi:hypothetical protein BD414DRAFT_64024 [Trametes punicea]|nr:hypothetical protein BD414DRAFT_64024 [Trametes punicea]